MNKKQLDRLIKHHAKIEKLNRPSISHFARKHGFHPSTLSRYISGKRSDLSPVTKRLIDELYVTTVF